MNELNIDVAIIGAGSAGMSAYAQARKSGAKALLIEAADYGTTCAREGCMPSKLLIAAAEASHQIDLAPAFGIEPGPKQIDGKQVMARVRAERDRFVGFVLQSIESIPAELKLKGRARFLGPNQLVVDEHTKVTFKAAVLATGSSTVIPPPYRNLGDRLITNRELFEMEDLPKSVCVIGPGVIGLELGQALHRLGVRVTILGLGGFLGPFSDPEVKKRALADFQEELDLEPDAKFGEIIRHIDPEHGDEVEMNFTMADGTQRKERYQYVMVVTGRRPNLDGLDLEKTGLKLGPSGLPEYDENSMQMGESNLFLAGDVNPIRPLLHEAIDEGKIAGGNAARFPEVTNSPRRTPLGIVFTAPQIGIVGLRYGELDLSCHAIGEVSFENQGRSRVMLQNKGFLRLYGLKKCGTLVGAEFYGPAAEHLAHLLSWAIQQRLTVPEILEMPFYHPVIEEGLRTGLLNLRKALKLGEPAPEHCMQCGVGG